MNPSSRLHLLRAVAIIAVLSLAVTACVNSTVEPTTTEQSSTTTTTTTTPSTSASDPATTSSSAATTTTEPVPPDTLVAPTTTLPPDAADPAVREQLGAQVAESIATTENLRGLSFLVPLEVLIVTPAGYASRAGEAFDLSLDRGLLGNHTGLYHLTKVMTPEDDLEQLRRDLYQLPDPAFYDWASHRLVVSGATTELGPGQRAVLVHEIVHALSDQLFSAGELRTALREDQADDWAVAADALIEGDASYFELLYIQGLTLDEQQEIALGAAGDTRGEGMPDVALGDFVFPFQDGLEFVAALVRSGGIAEVDAAYLRPPAGTRSILHPERHLRALVPVVVEPIDVELSGYTNRPSAGIGEFGLSQILSDTLAPDILTQTADGWVGDAYVFYERADGASAFAYRVAANTERDAIEITEAFIALTEDNLKAGSASNAGGGILYRANGYYVFLDRVETELTVIIATDEEAGATLREAIAPPPE